MSEKLHMKIIAKKITKTFLLKPSANDSEIKHVQMILNTSVKESAILIAILSLSMTSDRSLDAHDFKEHYQLTEKEYFEIFASLQALDKKGLICLGTTRHRSSVFFPYIEVQKQSAESILNGVGPYDNINKSDPFAWVDRYAALLQQRKDEKISYETYCRLLKTDVENMDAGILAKMELEKMQDSEKSIFMYAISKFIVKKRGAELEDYIRDVIGEESSSKEQNDVMDASLSVFTSGLIYKSTFIRGYDDKAVTVYPSLVAQKLFFGEKFIANKYLNVDFGDIHSIFGYFDKLRDCLGDSICPSAYFGELKSLVGMIEDKLPLKSYIKNLDEDEINLLFFCISEYINSESGISLSSIVDRLYELKSQMKRVSDKVENDKMKFLKDGIVEKKMEKSFFSSDLQLTLTPKGIRKLLQMNPAIKTGENAMVSVIKPALKANELYFPDETKAEIDVLSEALSSKRYKSIISDLSKKGFSNGFVCLFYGAPGTGKTAVCKEIARITKRDVVQVDISRIKDMYVGESEKRLKRVFTEYYALKYQMKSTPILLFNEADALIGKRINVERSVDQMNNSMQNILLEELEKFDGIFMATTNLVDNLDDAFSRRFLYKVHFKKPNKETREQIWRKYIPEIELAILEEVSGQELSGGQIENVAKKYYVDMAVKGNSGVSIGKLVKLEGGFKKNDYLLGFKIN